MFRICYNILTKSATILTVYYIDIIIIPILDYKQLGGIR